MDSEGTYCQAPRLKRGWQLWLGNGWVTITSVHVSGEHVLIGAADGYTYRVGRPGRRALPPGPASPVAT